MKINLSILGRLWTFDLAKQLQKRGYLNKLITSYPKFKTRQWNIPNNKVVSKLHLELITRIDDKTLKILKKIFKKNNKQYVISRIGEKR